MKITSKPHKYEGSASTKLEQPFSPEVVRNSLRQLYTNTKQAELLRPISIMEHHLAIEHIMGTLAIAGVLKAYRVHEPVELNVTCISGPYATQHVSRNSTYENEDWLIKVDFRGDERTVYTAELTYNFQR